MAQNTGLVVVLVGPPGAGKSTQAEILQKERKMTLISADSLVEQNKQAFEKFRRPAIQGVDPRVDPVLNRLVEEQLRAADLSKGVILDGYPASKDHGDHLTRVVQDLQLRKPLIIQLDLPDETVRKRLKTHNPNDVEQRLKDYHRELDFVRVYFPEADIHTIDASKKPSAVAKEIRKLLPK